MAFEMARVWDEVWPELGGVGIGIGGQMAGAFLDSSLETTRPYFQYAATTLEVGIGGYLIATQPAGATKDIARGLLFAGLVGVMVNLARTLYETATAEGLGKPRSAGEFFERTFALVPRRAMKLRAAGAPAVTEGKPIKLTVVSGVGGEAGKPALVTAGARYG